uniref:vitamin K-dependent gamma-carboxylase-like n=1 Tax=Styela clava TaxID=7725 RepID=UPI00193A96DE|nr:vitamin K-dependent gamma-carboxylase-like [Styela clava]
MRRYLDAFITKLYQPCDPSLLACFRICFGFLMMIDIPQERGMSRADATYDEIPDKYCTFPLIHGMKPFSQDVMIILYAILFLNAFFIMIGFLYRINIISFTVIYWYFFILDKSTWNNHSYLYGLIALLLSVSNAENFMSVDGFLDRTKLNTDVPQWNYALLRFQVFIVYFYAGLKKTEKDWLTGYSMNRLSREWVFDPFRFFMTNDQIDFWIVHIGGFLFDISVGFLLYFNKTRVIGLFLCGSFHGMNSRMFSIGMFPYVMFVSSFIFCDEKLFKNIIAKTVVLSHCVSTKASEKNSSCIYDESISSKRWKPNQIAAALFTVFYISSQSFLPYSHFITKGYNGWTQGLYGYSWDMMIHSFKNQHAKIMYKNLQSGEIGYLKEGVFLSGKRSRWKTQPEMAFQYAVCIREQLKKFELNDTAVYFDVWKSMNGRFQQRIFDHNVDLASYDWSPFKQPTFVMPLLSELSNRREKLREIKRSLRNVTSDYDVVFVADFSGMYLENFVHQDLGNTTIYIMSGEVIVESKDINVTLKSGGNLKITQNEFHRVHTVSENIASYYYIYVNTTAQFMKKRLNEYEKYIKDCDMLEGQGTCSSFDQSNEANKEDIQHFNPEITELYAREQRYKQSLQNLSSWKYFKWFVFKKAALFRRSLLLAIYATRNVMIGKPISVDELQIELEYLNDWMTPRKFQDSIVNAKEDSVSSNMGVKSEL